MKAIISLEYVCTRTEISSMPSFLQKLVNVYCWFPGLLVVRISTWQLNVALNLSKLLKPPHGTSAVKVALSKGITSPESVTLFQHVPPAECLHLAAELPENLTYTQSRQVHGRPPMSMDEKYICSGGCATWVDNFLDHLQVGKICRALLMAGLASALFTVEGSRGVFTDVASSEVSNIDFWFL